MVLRRLAYPDDVIGHLRSTKMRSLMPYRSELARDYMMLLDYDPTVVEFRALPIAFEFYHRGRLYEYLPDLIATLSPPEHSVALPLGSPAVTVICCRVFERWQTEEEAIGLGLTTVWCTEHGYNLLVLSPEMLDGTYMRNVKLLRTYALTHVASSQVERVISFLSERGGNASVHDIARVVNPLDEPYGWAVVLHLAFHHKVELPVQGEDVTPDTIVSLPPQAEVEKQEPVA